MINFIKRFKNWLKPQADDLLNGGLKLNHFRDAEYRNILGSDIYECMTELNKLLEKYNAYLKQTDDINTVLLCDCDSHETVAMQVWQ